MPAPVNILIVDHEQQEALSSGMNDVLTKHFQPDQLHEKITRLLKRKVKTQA